MLKNLTLRILTVVAVIGLALSLTAPVLAAGSSGQKPTTGSTANTSGQQTGPSTAGNPNAGCNQNNPTFSGTGANTSGPYNATCTGASSQNGVGAGVQAGRPCAGCVGKADNKNPSGQMPNGSDRNAGYECDRNQGIGQTNPAHTGCTTSATVTGQTSTTVTSRTSTSTTVYSPGNVPSVVPPGSVAVGTVSMGGSTTVTYRSGGTYYHVTYSPNGSYTYVATKSPTAPAAGGTMTSPGSSATVGPMGLYTAGSSSTAAGAPGTTGVSSPSSVSVAGSSSSSGATYGTSGAALSGAGTTTMLPRTGGGNSPDLPLLPTLIGSILAGLGILLRKVCRAAH